MGQMSFIILSTVAALYAAYLLSFRLYELDYEGKIKERVVFPRIVYILVFGVSFVPLLNLLCIVILVSLALSRNDYGVKSWLFEKPRKKEEKKE